MHGGDAANFLEFRQTNWWRPEFRHVLNSLRDALGTIPPGGKPKQKNFQISTIKLMKTEMC
jgi:hypothetical protein